MKDMLLWIYAVVLIPFTILVLLFLNVVTFGALSMLPFFLIFEESSIIWSSGIPYLNFFLFPFYHLIIFYKWNLFGLIKLDGRKKIISKKINLTIFILTVVFFIAITLD
jgi:hypothetical protein